MQGDVSNYSFRTKPVLTDYRFLGTTLLGAVSVGIVSVFSTIDGQLAMIGTWLSILAGLLVTQIQSAEKNSASFNKLLRVAGLVPDLTQRADILKGYTSITQSLHTLSKHSDPVLVDFACKKLDLIAEQIGGMARGLISFNSTESWRMTYEQILRSKGVKTYRSVAWFKSPEYWQDEPGKKSLQLNFELQENGLMIERIVIVRDALWAAHEGLPAHSTVQWLEPQHAHGIKLYLVRESALVHEPGYCRDMGIYDDRAVGFQELDDRCRTTSFTLCFDKAEIERAQSHWQRLRLYARPYDQFLN